MIGGEEAAVRHLDPIFTTLAPGVEAAPRTPGREKAGGTAEHGYLHCGPSGAGHFVKMVHNGIEYGLMAAYAEGLNILHHANAGKQQRDRRRRNHAAAPPRALPVRPEPGRHRRGLAPRQRDRLVAAGSRPRPRCCDSPDLAKFAGRVSDSGEGRWTIMAAIDEAAPAPVLSAALYDRFSSRGEADFADRVLSAMRYQFGGHEEKAAARREAPDDRLPFGRAGALRRDGRPRPQDDLPGALCDGETRRPERPGHRRRLLEVEPGATAQAREGQHQAIGRDR